jgi:serine/threonine protein kinase
MDSARWSRIQELFHEAAERPAGERRNWLRGRTGDDPTLVDEVLQLLDAEEAAGTVIDRDVGEVAADLLDTDSADGVTGRRFGAYRVIRPLGEGGMGVVYLAERDDLGSRAAVKVLRDAWISPARRERFQAEQRLLARLDHPNIGRLFDAGTLADGTPWFVLEYVDGRPLTAYAREKRLSIRERLLLFRSVCEAVLHAHGQAILHRDLKPSNILVKDDGTVKLIDFGIARQLEDTAADRTRTGLRLMTPAYAAPEQVRGDRLGVPTDIYALGVILYELLAGRLPFDLDDRTPGEAETIIRTADPTRPSTAARKEAATRGAPAPDAGPAGWGDLDVLCLTAMHKEYDRRYRSVDALIRDIDHFLRDEPLEARPDSLGYRTRKFVRRNWRPLAAAGLALAAMVALAVGYTIQLEAARDAALAESRRTRRIQTFMTDLFAGGDSEAGPADTLRVVSLLARGRQEAGVLAEEPQVQAELFATLGGIHRSMGDLALADSLLTLAVERRRRSAPGTDYGRSLVDLGLLRVDQSRLAEADSLVRAGRDVLLAARPPDPRAVAAAVAALGLVQENQGEYDAAIATLTDAIRKIDAAGGDEAERAATLTELANCHYYAGHYDVADSLNRIVLAVDRRIHGANHPHVASDLINLGAIQQELGHLDAAADFYRQALTLYEGWYGHDHYETAASLTMLARVLIYQEKNDEATRLLTESLAIRTRVYGPNTPQVASTLNELARVAQSEGRLAEAEAGYLRMADIYRQVYGDTHQVIGIALANLSGVRLEMTQFAASAQAAREALAQYGATLPADHLYAGIAHLRLGRALLQQGRFDEALGEARAGYDILKVASPDSPWLGRARKDLVTALDTLGRGAEADVFRAELADTTTGR